MNKFQILIFIVVLSILGIIFFATQGNQMTKNISSIPTLPPDANGITPITPIAQQQQAQQNNSQPLPTYGVEEELKASISAVIKTSKGDISVTLFGKDAPNTVKNFIAKAKSSFYKGLTFHRVEDWVVQGGDPAGNGTGGGQMLTEPNQLPFVTGSLGIARGGDPRISNDAQFFITKTDADWLNGQYTNFGVVSGGMDVVNKIKIGDKILGITIE